MTGSVVVLGATGAFLTVKALPYLGTAHCFDLVTAEHVPAASCRFRARELGMLRGFDIRSTGPDEASRQCRPIAAAHEELPCASTYCMRAPATWRRAINEIYRQPDPARSNGWAPFASVDEHCSDFFVLKLQGIRKAVSYYYSSLTGDLVGVGYTDRRGRGPCWGTVPGVTECTDVSVGL